MFTHPRLPLYIVPCLLLAQPCLAISLEINGGSTAEVKGNTDLGSSSSDFINVGSASNANTLNIYASLSAYKTTVGGNQTSFPSLPDVTPYNYNSVEIFDGGSLNLSAYMYVGYAGSGNTITVNSGASLNIGTFLQLSYTTSVSGSDSAYASNSVYVNGGTMSVGTYAYVGSSSSNNLISVSDGGSATMATLRVGDNYSESGNGVIVSGSGSTLSVSSSGSYNGDLIVGRRGNDNFLTVQEGAAVDCDSLALGALSTSSYSSNGNQVLVTGGSQLEIRGNLAIGAINSGYATEGNRVLVQDGALVVVGGNLTIQDAGEGDANYLFIEGGFLAWAGDHTATGDDALAALFDGRIMIGDGSGGMVAATADTLSYFYCASDAEGLAATGFAGLSGYTILGAAVPEPSTYALMGGIAALGMALYRRRRA